MNKIIAKFITFAENCAIAMLLLMCICVTIQILGRYVLQTSQAWTDEFARYSFMMLTYSGAAIATYKNSHLRMDFLLNFMKGASRKTMLLISDALMVVYSAFGVFLSLQMTGETMETGETFISISAPIWIVWACIPFFFILITMLSILVFCQHAVEKAE